ncbi:MAG TPA: protein translocase subunit SecD [Clostridiales bacterium]|jgi:preprotein translocase subunit SecD|nr:protein translocase subunit SecD [Clostridiales bacterium]
MNKSRILFALIIAVLVLISYSAVFGFTVGDYIVSPFGEEIDLGLDLSGGVYVVLEANTDETGDELAKKMQQTKAIIQQRVDGLGVAEPNITIENNDRIRVELAGLENPQEAIDLIGKTAQLEFRDLQGNVIVTGENVEVSEVTYNRNNQPAVALEFDSEGAEKFATATGLLMDMYPGDENRDNRIIEIVLDDEVISAPSVSETITDGRSIIDGSYTIESAANLANLIRAGALPLEMREIEVNVVGPTLGLESLNKSITAGAIGLLLIFVLMLIMYRVPGLVADLALSIYILIALGVFIYIDAKLTLPGIAGFILSIGMAVDANVIIFERIKEELRVGKTIRTAVDSGFKQAMTTIIDANVTTLIAGLVLYNFGTGTIRGFAVTLLIGLVVSMFTAVFITRFLLRLVIKMDITRSKKLFGGA